MSRLAITLLLGFSVFAPACGHRASTAPNTPNMNEKRYNKLLNDAKGALACADVKYDYLGDDIHKVSGCNKQKSYVLYCAGPTCRWVASPTEQAVTEMSCAAEGLKATKITASVYSVEGCSQKFNYTLKGYTWTGVAEAGSAAPVAAAEPTPAAAPAPAQDAAAAAPAAAAPAAK